MNKDGGYAASDALLAIRGALSAELQVHPFDEKERSKAQLFAMGGAEGHQFALVLGDKDAATGIHSALSTRLVFEKCRLPDIRGIVPCDKPYDGQRVKVQKDSRLAAPNQVSCHVESEAALVTILKWYAHQAFQNSNSSPGSDSLAAASSPVGSERREESALVDLAAHVDVGAPDRALRVRNEYLRKPLVRQAVLRFANGNCEYCRRPGFLMPSGERYLEAHHVIALADEGDDSVDNVIALCPEHHREAHFGVAGEELEKEFMKVIAGRKGVVDQMIFEHDAQ